MISIWGRKSCSSAYTTLMHVRPLHNNNNNDDNDNDVKRYWFKSTLLRNALLTKYVCTKVIVRHHLERTPNSGPTQFQSQLRWHWFNQVNSINDQSVGLRSSLTFYFSLGKRICYSGLSTFESRATVIHPFMLLTISDSCSLLLCSPLDCFQCAKYQDKSAG